MHISATKSENNVYRPTYRYVRGQTLQNFRQLNPGNMHYWKMSGNASSTAARKFSYILQGFFSYHLIYWNAI